jgi:hypothetical protein
MINECRNYVVDSSQRISGTDTDFLYNIDIPQTADYDHVVLNQISIPRSFYDIEEPYNTFILKENSTIINCTISEGMYNVYSLILQIQTVLNTNTTLGLTYSVTYPNAATSPNTNKLTFTISTLSSYTISLTFPYMYYQFGFEQNVSNSFVSVVGGYSLTSVNSIQVTGMNRLFLCSDICGLSDNNLLHEILCVGEFPSCSFIFYENLNPHLTNKVFTNKENTAFRFQLFDKNNRVVNLRGLPLIFSFTLFKKSRTDELLYDYYKIKNQQHLMFD